jgi:mono/diheme cytochrome c family protein
MSGYRCVLALGLLVGCSGGGSDGVSLYSQPISGGNTFACATCHALEEPASDGIRRPGHQIGDAASRPSYKNGQISSLLDAVNTCLTEWMAAPPWSEGDADWMTLRDYLEESAPAEAPAITIDIADVPDQLSGGDIGAGQNLFNSSCVGCHGTDAAGTDRAPPLFGSLLDADYIAERVRRSGLADSPTYPGLTGGRMPFWGGDRLSDDELVDIVAFVLSNEPDMPSGPDAGPSGPDAGPSDCASTHARVGQTAELSTLFHGVMGTATIVDDCTIRIDMFHYDGTGIDVRIYGGLGGNFSAGFSMSDDLLRPGGYNGETLTATVPVGRTLDELDGISVWCVDVDVSFGTATFPPL